METLRKKTISEVHFQHKVWWNQLNFYKQELKLFRERLEEVAAKNPGQEAHIAIEQFQNKFIIQRNEIDELNHLVNINEDEAIYAGEIHIRRIDYETTEQYLDIKNRMAQFEKLYKELKDEFYQFLCKWM